MNKKAKTATESLQLVPQPRLEATIEVKHPYTDKERVSLSEELVEGMQQLHTAEEGLKAAKAEWKSRIDTLIAEQEATAGLIRNGYEMRSKDCIVILNPKGKVKYFYDEEKQERLDTQPMTQGDYQTQMDFERDHATQRSEG